MIYIDPPYGIKFGSNWQVSARKRDVKDGKREDAAREAEQVKAFRDTWELGLHSYLTYLRDRLHRCPRPAHRVRVHLVQIGDENVHLVRELHGRGVRRENFVSFVSFRTTSGSGSFAGGTRVLSSVNDYLIWFAKDLNQVKYRQFVPHGGVGRSGCRPIHVD